MFRTEITFDTSLPQAEIEQLCAMTDAIFAKEDLVCIEKNMADVFMRINVVQLISQLLVWH